MSETNKYHGWISAGLFNGLQKLSVPLFGIITTMLLAKRALTKQEMGVWAIFLIVTSFVEILRQSLVKTSMIKFINHHEADKHTFILSAALFLNALISVILIGFLLLFSPYFAAVLKAPQLEPMMHIFTAGLLLLIPFSHFEWIMYTKSEFKALFYTFFWRQGITLLLMIIFLAMDRKISLDLLVVFYCAGIFAGAIAGYRFIHHHLSKSFSLSAKWILEMWHFGKYVFGTGISSIIFGNAGQMMTSPILGSTVYTASQSIAARVINIADMPSAVLSDIVFPKSAKKENAENTDRVKYYYEKTVGATLCFCMPMVLFILLFPKFIILVLAGQQYFDAIPYLQLIAFTGIFLAFLKAWGVIIDSVGKPALNFLIITFLAAVHLVLAYFFITNAGFLGAAYALLATHIIGFIITQLLLYKKYRISFISCFRYAFSFYPELSKIVMQKLSVKWKAR
jgi:O-antigen/teichoic acid export membrane protein